MISFEKDQGIEYRYVPIESHDNAITGIVMRYGSKASIAKLYTEEFEQGSVRYSDVIVNVQHDRKQPVARLGDTLMLDNSDTELRARIMLPKTRAAEDVRAMVDAGILRGLSMEFLVHQARWEGRHRIIQKAEMKGIGIVDTPAYAESKIVQRWKEWNILYRDYPKDYFV